MICASLLLLCVVWKLRGLSNGLLLINWRTSYVSLRWRGCLDAHLYRLSWVYTIKHRLPILKSVNIWFGPEKLQLSSVRLVSNQTDECALINVLFGHTKILGGHNIIQVFFLYAECLFKTAAALKKILLASNLLIERSPRRKNLLFYNKIF
jgi:hypothetical protein